MKHSAVINPKAGSWASHQTNLGVDSYDLERLWLPDTDIGRSVVLDIGSPKFTPNPLYAFDRPRFQNHGTIVGPIWKQLPSGVWVLAFDRVDDYISHSNIQYATAIPWTVLNWIKWDGQVGPGGNYIGYVGNSGAGFPNFMLLNNTAFTFTFRAVDNAYYQTVPVANSSLGIVNLWTLVAWIADGAGNLRVLWKNKTTSYDGTVVVGGANTTQVTLNVIGRGENNVRWSYGGYVGSHSVISRAITLDTFLQYYLTTNWRYQ